MTGTTLAMLAAALVATTPQPTPVPTPRPNAAATMGRASAATPRGKSLADVARSVKLQLPRGDSKVITNETLKEMGAGVQLTVGSAPPPAAAQAAESGGADPAAAAEAQKKAYWQGQYFAARQEADRLASEEQSLIQEVARLEREFYSRDDPYQRDNVIKPAWDTAVTKLRDVQQRLPAARRGPDEVANAARREGALPGWFRESPPPPGPADSTAPGKSQ
jgi:hypothetical protein